MTEQAVNTSTEATSISTWREVYAALRDDAVSTAELAIMAGVTRTVICAVIAGTYPHPHQPRFANGVELLARLKDVPDALQRIDRGRITARGQFVPGPYAP